MEDQQKLIIPLTRTTEHLFYNERLILDTRVLTEPRAWVISKINRVNQRGTALITLYQDHFDQNRDYIEKDTSGNVIGMWADYFSEQHQPIPDTEDPIYSIISYASKPQVKVAGSYKKLTVTFYKQDEVVSWQPGTWAYEIDGQDASALISTSPGVDGSQIKVKFDGDDSYIGKVLVVSYITTDGVTSSVNLDIVGL